MKRVLKDYLTFSRKERVALIIFLILIGIFIVLPYFIKIKRSKPVVDLVLQQQIMQLQQLSHLRDSAEGKVDSVGMSELFEFDPNTLTFAEWKRLGIQEKTIRTIINYRNKGGKFYKPDDLRKIWGLSKDVADKIVPFVRISATFDQSSQHYFHQQKWVASSAIGVLDINTATVDQFMQIPGLEHSLAYRIINYKENVGGFSCVAQIRNVFGMTDSIYQLILPHVQTQPATLKRININTATYYELSQNPFIRKDVANAIIIYRNQHGLYHQIDDIKKIAFITEEIFLQIVPYLKVE